MKYLKGTIWLMMFIAFLTLSSGIFPPVWAEDGAPKNLATVNGQAITQNDLDREFHRIKLRAASRQQPIDDSVVPAMKENILETLINRELLYQTSQKKGITLGATEVESQLEKIKQQISPGKSFAQALAEINITEKEFTSQISKAISIQKLLDAEVYQNITVTEKETRIFYDNNPQFFKKPEQVKASHILIQVDRQSEEEQKLQARKKIEEIQTKLKHGEDFAELAKQFSECPSGKNGGELGVFERDKMVKPFSDAAFALKPGEVSDIIETQFGFHIIKVFEKIPETKLLFKDIKERLSQNMKRQKSQKETTAYINRLKETADIQRVSP